MYSVLGLFERAASDLNDDAMALPPALTTQSIECRNCHKVWTIEKNCEHADLRGRSLLRRECLDLVPQRLRLLLHHREATPQDAVLALQPLRRLKVRRGFRLESASFDSPISCRMTQVIPQLPSKPIHNLPLPEVAGTRCICVSPT